MRVDRRIVDVVCLVGLIALVLVGGFICTKLAVGRRRSVQRKNLRIANRLQELSDAKVVLERLSTAVDANQAALEQIRTRLPESESMGTVLSDLDAMMNRNGVDLSKVVPGNPVREALCMRTPLSFSCGGSFADLHAVLYGLETQQRVIRVDRVSITGDADGICGMDVSCSVYGR